MNDDQTTGDETEVEGADAPRSRRQLLTLAGAAVAGGTAIALGSASPAGAANGDELIIGQANSATIDTSLSSSGAAGAVLNVNGTSDGVGAIQAAGQGDALDIKLTGTGRLGQDYFGAGNAQPSFDINDTSIGGQVDPLHEIVRGRNGTIWASTGIATGASTQWKRMNTPRFDNPNGSGGVFSPFRLLDSRPGQASAISRSTPLPTNTNTTIDIDNLANVPSGTVGVFGNITVLNSNYTGFVTLFPTGASVPTVANINFGTGELVGNFFQVGLSNSGSLTIRPGDAGGRTVDVIIDIFGYVQ